MSRPKSARLRMSLFASSSLVGSSLLAGMGGLVVTMAPSAAFAACTAPPGTVTCTGTDAAVVISSGDANLQVNFNNEVVTAGGVIINDIGATAARNLGFDAQTGTNSITNIGPSPVGNGLSITSFKGGAITGNSGATKITATNGDGVFLYQAGSTGAISYASTGVITTNTPNTYYAVEVVNSGSGATTVNLGPLTVAPATTVPVDAPNVANGGVRIQNGSGGGLTLSSNGLVNNTGVGRAGIELIGASSKVTLNDTGNVTSSGGSAVRASTGGASTITLNFTGAGSTISGAGTSAGAATISTNSVLGATTVVFGAGAKPTNSVVAPAAAVTVTNGVGSGLSGITLAAQGTGAVTYRVGQSITGNDALGGTLASVTQLAGTAVLNGHVDFTGLTGASNIVLVGESTSTGTYQSLWNLGTGTSTFGDGADNIENRGTINIGASSAPAQVRMNFGGPGITPGIPASAGPPATVAIPGINPVQTGTPNGDRIYNRGAQAPTSVQNLYTPGTINIVGSGGNLTVTGLEIFTNEGAAYLNIRNNTDLSDFVGQGASKTTASAQSFGMNPGGAGGTISDYYATASGGPVKSTFSQFALMSGTRPALQGSNGIPGVAQLSGGVNLADGDTLDVFAISGQLYGNANYNSTPVTGSRFLVDFDLKTRTADQLWFGDLFGNVSVIPRFNYVGAGIAPAYDPDGIRFATIVANPATDNSFTVDYQSYFNQKDVTYASLANSVVDGGLYRGFVVYKQDGGARSVTVNGSSTDFSSTKATGGYYLAFLPDTEFYQLASLGSTVQEAVRDATGNYYTRQADLRDAVGDNVAGPWLKISGSHAKLQEDVSYNFLPTGPGLTRTVGNYYTQTTVDITAGGDAVAALGKGKVVAGAAVGYTDSDVRFLGLGYGGVSGGQVSAPIPFIPRYDENRTAMEGYHIGAYASYIQDQFFVDGSLSYTSLDLHSLFATLNNDVFSTNTKTIDAEVLGGVRFVADDVFSVEPVVGLSFMNTEQDDLNFGVAYGATAVTFPKFRSLRPGVGGRVKVASATDLYKLNLGLGIMWWHELKTDGSRIKATSGTNSFSVADLRGGMDTVAIDTSANMIFANGLSSFVNVSARGNMDAYLDVGFSAGARYRW